MIAAAAAVVARAADAASAGSIAVSNSGAAGPISLPRVSSRPGILRPNFPVAPWLLALTPLVSSFAVRISNLADSIDSTQKTLSRPDPGWIEPSKPSIAQAAPAPRTHTGRRGMSAALFAAAAILAIASAPKPGICDQGGPSQPLRNVAGIVTHRDGKQVPVGTAFFVAVPSRVFEGRSFVYLVTAHHNLLDAAGKPASGLYLTFEDAKSGATREEPLPPETKWVLDPGNETTDVAAVPFNPSGANIAPIPLGSIMATETEMAALAETGAQAYYLTAASVGINNPRFEALARFGRVSVARPLEAEVPGAGIQNLCFMDGGGTPGFSSGAPVFIQAGLRFVLWGILESTNSASASPTFQGLAGLVPANSVAETVEAMAAAQEKNLRKPR